MTVTAELDKAPLPIGLHLRPVLRPKTSVALVDLDNWHEARPDAPVEASLSDVVSEVTLRLISVAPETEFISIRLYGGWTEDGAFTQFASEVSAHLPSVDPFPMRSGPKVTIVHGELVLAMTLSIAPALALGDTCRKRSGPPRIRLATSPLPIGCVDAGTCPARMLKKFTQSSSRECPTESCAVTSSVAFSTRQQKMVDTLMACDLLDMAHDKDVLAITVVTADSDLLPPLIHARTLNTAHVILQTNLPYWSPAQLSTLRRCGVVYFGPEGVEP